LSHSRMTAFDPQAFSRLSRREKGSSPTNLFRESEFATDPTVLPTALTCQEACFIPIQKGGHMASVDYTKVWRSSAGADRRAQGSFVQIGSFVADLLTRAGA
jgi:hypothetical protein